MCGIDVHASVHTHMEVYVSMCGHVWRPEVDLGDLSLGFQPFFLREGGGEQEKILSLNLGLADSASLAAGSRDLRFTFLPAPRARVTRVQPSFYHGCWESELRFRYLHGRTF